MTRPNSQPLEEVTQIHRNSGDSGDIETQETQDVPLPPFSQISEPTKHEILSDPVISHAMELFDGTLEGCITPDMKVYRTKNSKLVKPSPEYIESFPKPNPYRPYLLQIPDRTKSAPMAYWLNLAKAVIAKPSPYKSEVDAIKIGLSPHSLSCTKIWELLSKKSKEAKIARPR